MRAGLAWQFRQFDVENRAFGPLLSTTWGLGVELAVMVHERHVCSLIAHGHAWLAQNILRFRCLFTFTTIYNGQAWRYRTMSYTTYVDNEQGNLGRRSRERVVDKQVGHSVVYGTIISGLASMANIAIRNFKTLTWAVPRQVTSMSSLTWAKPTNLPLRRRHQELAV